MRARHEGGRVVLGAALTLVLAGLLTGCGGDDTDEAAATQSGEASTEPEEVRLAVTDLQGLEELQREFGAFVDVFEETSGHKLDFFPVTDRTAAAAALDAERVDLVFTGPAEYVVMAARTDAEPVVAIRRPDYHSCIYTTADSGITELADLVGTKVGMSDIGSTSGHLGPSQLLVDGGVDPQEDVEVLTLGDAVHEALKRGDVDAVGVGCHDYEEYIEADGAAPSDYPVLVEGPPLPPDVILAHPELDEDLVARIKATFEDNWDDLLAAMLEGKDNAKYENASLVLVDDSDYDDVRSMYRAIGVDDFTEFVGD
ncbi:MAG: PhnD/SsuA/transferrin family substrate-binding protein [Acidimicrobiia bacterium]